MLLDTDLVHPASGVDGFHPCGVEALADIVVPDPQRGRPQAGAETDRLIKLLAASLLAVMGHLQVIAVQIVPVRSGEHLVAALDTRIAEENDRLVAVPSPDDRTRIVVGIGSELLVGHAQHFQVQPVDLQRQSRLAQIDHLGCGRVEPVELGIELAGVRIVGMLGGKQRVGKPGVIDLSDLQIAGLLQNF